MIQPLPAFAPNPTIPVDPPDVPRIERLLEPAGGVCDDLWVVRLEAVVCRGSRTLGR